MNRIGKLKAYTMMELVVVMLISAVVISIAYSSFRIIQKQFLSFRQSQESVAQTVLLDRLLSTDFSACTQLLKTEEGIRCVFPGASITYRLSADFMLRTDHGRQDTFFIQPIRPQTFLLRQAVDLPEETIDELRFEYAFGEQNEVVRYTKRYGADVLMKTSKPVNP